MATITLASILSRTKTYLQNSSYMSDDDIMAEIRLFMDVELPLQNDLSIFKGIWRFQTKPHEYIYAMPLGRYTSIGSFMTVDGVEQQVFFEERLFYNDAPYNTYRRSATASVGNGGSDYTFTLDSKPVLRGYKTLDGHIASKVFFSTLDSTGSYAQCGDDGAGNLIGDTVNGTINYITGDVTLNFTNTVPQGNEISSRHVSYTPGYPARALFRGEGNLLEFRTVPNSAFIIEVEAYLKPTTLIDSMDELQYNWLVDYIALGSARRIFNMLVNDEMLRRTDERYKYYKALINNRTARQQSVRDIKTIYDSSIINYE